MSQMTHGGHLFLMLFIFTRPHNPFQNQFWRIKMTKIRPSAFRIFIVGSSLAILLCVLSVMMLNTRPAYAGGSACDNVTMDSIKKHTPVPPADIISKRQTFGMCEVILKIGTNLIPLYVADNYVIAGEIYSNKTQVTQATLDKLNSVSAEETKKTFTSMVGQLEKASAITYTPKGKVNRKLYMFSTTRCPYCIKAAKEIQPILDKTGTQLMDFFLEGHGEA